MYEGRTRGKRTRYTFSEDDEDVDSDEQSNKRSRRSGRITPAEHDEPVITASGRQVKARNGGLYGESLLSGQQHLVERGSSDAENSKFRTRSGRGAETSRISQRKNYTGADGVNDDIDSDIPSEEWNSDQNDVDDLNDNLADVEDDEDEDMSDGGLDDDDVEIAQPTKIITIKLGEQTSARLARSRQDEEQRQQNSSIRQNGSSITFSNEEGLRALPLQSIILTTAAEAKAKSNVDQSEDVSNSDTTQVSFTSNSPAPIRVKDDQFTNGIVQIESSPSQSRLMNGIFKPHSPAAIFGGPIASDQIKTSKLEEPRFLQTLTPP